MALPITPIQFAFCHKPKDLKLLSLRELFGLDRRAYAAVFSDMKQTAIDVGLDMTKPYMAQDKIRIFHAHSMFLDIYPSLTIFQPWNWPIDAILTVVLKSTAQRAHQVTYEARATERNGLLIEALLGVLHYFWPWISLTALYQLPLIPSYRSMPASPPRFSLLVPPPSHQPWTTTLALAPLPQCPHLIQQGWTLKLTLRMDTQGEIAMRGTAQLPVQRTGSKLTILQVVLLRFLLIPLLFFEHRPPASITPSQLLSLSMSAPLAAPNVAPAPAAGVRLSTEELLRSITFTVHDKPPKGTPGKGSFNMKEVFGLKSSTYLLVL
ncbi:hypothetical protein FS749_002103, partial [Ceratobasidium sp. UAMH 11750]